MHGPEHVRQPKHFPSVARRIREDPSVEAEARAARSLGLTIDQWDDLDEYNRAHALAVDLIEAERKAGQCTQCGGPADVCQNPRNQHAYQVTFRRCYRTQAISEAEERRTKLSKGDMRGVVSVVTFDPSKVKPEKEARRG